MTDSTINIEKKLMPHNSNMFIYEVKLNKPDMDKQIIKVINKQGDKQNHKTNVKAQMTEWRMWDYPGFKELAGIILTVSKHACTLSYNTAIKPIIKDMWGMKYKSNEETIPHDHWPALWSCAYYVNAPKDVPGLFFPEMGEQGGERKIEPGLLIMFQGHIKHAVRPKKFKGSRYVVSANIHADPAAKQERRWN